MKIARLRIPVRASLVFGLFASCLTLMFSSPAWADTFTVTNADDSGQGSLRNAIDQANTASSFGSEPNTINASNIEGTITLQSALPELNTDMTILGPGAGELAVDGNGSRVFRVGATTAEVTISDLTVTGGASPENSSGGGIDNIGDLTLNRVVVTGNKAGTGGGISNSFFGTLTVNNSAITGNTAEAISTDPNSATFGAGGGGVSSDGALVINNSTISNNLATTTVLDSVQTDTTSRGGGISAFGAFTLNNSTVSGNRATISGDEGSEPTEVAQGGGISNSNFSASTTSQIVNSTISGNAADDNGGGVHNFGKIEFTNATIANNGATAGGNFSNGGGSNRAGVVATFENTILASPTGGNCANAVSTAENSGNISNGGNLEGGTDTCNFGETTDIPMGNAVLGNLADNGGPTQTHALGTDSMAINNAVDANCPETDQRGVARPENECDIGAFEVGDPRQIPETMNDGPYTTNEGEKLIVNAPGVLGNDGPPDDLVAVFDDRPQDGSVALMEDGSFEYTPDAGTFGEDTFTYRASDGFEESEITTVTINVVEDTDNPDDPDDPDNPDDPDDPDNPGGPNNPGRCTIVGTPDNDILRGTPRRDVICGLDGNDVLRGMGGNDIIRGGPGNDVLHGMGGDDRLFGQAGNDALRGGPGKDILRGGPGKDDAKQ